MIKNKKNKTALVTGGAGFIGSNLCQRLIEKDTLVICVDNLVSGSKKNIAHLLSNNNFDFIEHDICEPYNFSNYRNIDYIYHFASPADPNVHSRVSYMSLPFETMKVNTTGTWNMCELALKRNARLSYSSTSEVYGDPLVSPQDEKYRGNVSTTGPRSVYDESKRFGETIVSAYARLKNLDARITRIFNTYGPKMNVQEGRAVVNFIKQAVQEKPLTIYGDGLQTRSFCFVDDMVEGQILAMEKSNTNGEVINLGNPDERTILEFAELIKRLTKSPSEISFSEPLPQDDPVQRKPSIEKAKKLLGWRPKTKIEEGLDKTINYFRNELQ